MNSEILILGFAIALASSFLGVLVVLRRLALVSDALSHVALPGLALALLLGWPPFVGAFLFLALAVFITSAIQRKFEFGTETIIGILFTTGLALGILLTPSGELPEALFGDIASVNLFDVIVAIAGGILVFVGTLFLWRNILKVVVSPELALGEQINIKRADFFFLLLLTLSVAIGIKAIGALLMGALIILPASTAKNISKNLRQMVLFSLCIGAGSMLLGLLLSRFYGWPPGPTVVLINSVLFALSLFF